MADHGDERGFFWEDIKQGNLPKLPKAKGGERSGRAHRGRDGNVGVGAYAPGTPSLGPAPVSDWVAPRELPRLHHCTIGLDVESEDPGLFTRGPGWCFADGGQVLGAAITWPGGGGYFPFAHPEASADDIARAHVMAWLADLFRDPSITVDCYNASYDLGWCSKYDTGYPVGQVHDGYVMATLLDEHRRSYKLDHVSKDYGFEGKDESLLKTAAAYYHITKNIKGNLKHLPAQYVGPYAHHDAALAVQVVDHSLPLLAAEQLERVYALEMGQVPILLAMRRQGVKVDIVGAELLVDKWRIQRLELEAEIKRLTGMEVPIWEAAAIAKACDANGLTYPRTAPSAKKPTGDPSFTAPWLTLSPVPWHQHLLRARKLDKAETTFGQGYVLNLHEHGRLHCQFNPLRNEEGGAVSGRYSSSNPNLQNIPTRDKEIGPAMRGLFIPEDGELWCAADYSQQEPRLTVHYADVINCMGARAAVLEYTHNPKMDYHNFMAELTGLVRENAKTINLAAGYGMGPLALCKRLNLPTIQVEQEDGTTVEMPGAEGLAILQKYHANAPFVQGLFDACSRKAKKDKVIKTIGGRRCRFPHFESPHKAMNRLIQGSAADMMKAAMIDVFKAGIIPLVTVHDELGVSVADQAAGDRVAQIMMDTMPLRLPLLVDAGLGINWWEAKHVE